MQDLVYIAVVSDPIKLKFVWHSDISNKSLILQGKQNQFDSEKKEYA